MKPITFLAAAHGLAPTSGFCEKIAEFYANPANPGAVQVSTGKEWDDSHSFL